jgi:hypothetical protein
VVVLLMVTVVVVVVVVAVLEAILGGCKVFRTYVLYMFLICAHKKFYIPSASGPLIIAVKLKTKSTTVKLFNV